MATGTIKPQGIKTATVTGNVASSGAFQIGTFTDRIVVAFESSFNYGGFIYTNGNSYSIRFVQVASDNSKIFPAPATNNVTVTYYYLPR